MTISDFLIYGVIPFAMGFFWWGYVLNRWRK